MFGARVANEEDGWMGTAPKRPTGLIFFYFVCRKAAAEGKLFEAGKGAPVVHLVPLCVSSGVLFRSLSLMGVRQKRRCSIWLCRDGGGVVVACTQMPL